MEYTDTLIALITFGVFMGAPFVPILQERLDYARSTVMSVLWYILGVLTLFYTTNLGELFPLTGIAGSIVYAIATIMLMFVFAHYWQVYGRPLMPVTPYSHEATTFYDFTPHYALVKGLEIFFQGVCAAVIITNLFQVHQSVLVTGVIFGVAFFLVHAIAVAFFGIEWAVFVAFASVVAGVVPAVLLLTVPGGILLLFSFHILMYLLFLVFMRRRVLYKQEALLTK